MISRRGFATAALAAMATAAFRPSAATAATVMSDDGLHTQSWFLQSFLMLEDDLAEATAAGKRLVVMWEQKGCPYCRDVHLVNFADPAIETYVRDNFNVLSLNLHGSRPVTDFDGEVLEERKLARKYGIVFTPTFQFFPEDLGPKGPRRMDQVEILRVPGYLKPAEFLTMFQFVRDRAYAGQDFPSYLKERMQRS